MEEPTKEELDARERELKLVQRLRHMEEFQTWRDNFVQPIIDSLEYEIATKADTMDEVVLRSNMKHLNSLKYFFKVIFEEADSVLKE